MELFSASLRKIWKEWNLRVTVLLSITLQILLITLGNRRKHNHKLWIRIVVWCAYLSTDVIATFALGIITNNISNIYDEKGGFMDANTELAGFWAPFLLLHLGGPDTITAFSLEDNELWLRHFLGLVVQTIMAIYVLLMSWNGSILSILSLLMFIAGFIKYGERTWVLRKASTEKIRESLEGEGNSGPLRYFFSESYRVQYGQKLLAAYCLMDISFEPLFFGHRMEELYSHIIKRGFLLLTSLEDTFQVIEMALGFMYDFLFTKAPLIYTHRGLGLRTITFSLTSFVLVLFPIAIHKDKYSNTDLTITFILLVGAIILEIYSALLLLFSDRFLVWLITCGKVSLVMDTLKSFLPKKWWSNNMSQFSLLSFIMKEKRLPCPNILNLLSIDFLEKQYYAADMEITKELKTLVFHYLQNKVGARHGVGAGSENIQTTAPSHVTSHISDLDFTHELEKSILAWHAATDIWYELDGENIKKQGSAFKLHCELICQISRYMFYLLVLCPDMVSNASMNQIKLQSFLSAAREAQFRSKNAACTNFKDILDNTITKMESGKQDFIVYEKKLSRNEHFIKFFKDSLPHFFGILREQTLEERWKIISLTWLEMLPYAACKCKGNHHAQQLKDGGEFLTHVWLLTVLFGFTHDKFTSDPPAPAFNSVMPLLNSPTLFGIPKDDTNPQI